MTNGLTPLTPEQQTMYEQRALHEGRLHNILVGVDQLANLFTGGNPDETISSRAARAAENGSEVGIALSKFLNVFQPDHGIKAQLGDLARGEAVAATEEASPGLEPAPAPAPVSDGPVATAEAPKQPSDSLQ